MECFENARDYGEKPLDVAREAEDVNWTLHYTVPIAQTEGGRCYLGTDRSKKYRDCRHKSLYLIALGEAEDLDWALQSTELIDQTAVGRWYLQQESFQKARDYRAKPLGAARESENVDWTLHYTAHIAQTEVGRCYIEMERFKKARHYRDKALNWISFQDADYLDWALRFTECIDQMAENESFEKAWEDGEKSLSAAREAEDLDWTLRSTVPIAQTEVKLPGYQPTFASLKPAIKSAQTAVDIERLNSKFMIELMRDVGAIPEYDQQHQERGSDRGGSRGSYISHSRSFEYEGKEHLKGSRRDSEVEKDEHSDLSFDCVNMTKDNYVASKVPSQAVVPNQNTRVIGLKGFCWFVVFMYSSVIVIHIAAIVWGAYPDCYINHVEFAILSHLFIGFVCSCYVFFRIITPDVNICLSYVADSIGRIYVWCLISVALLHLPKDWEECGPILPFLFACLFQHALSHWFIKTYVDPPEENEGH